MEADFSFKIRKYFQTWDLEKERICTTLQLQTVVCLRFAFAHSLRKEFLCRNGWQMVKVAQYLAPKWLHWYFPVYSGAREASQANTRNIKQRPYLSLSLPNCHTGHRWPFFSCGEVEYASGPVICTNHKLSHFNCRLSVPILNYRWLLCVIIGNPILGPY